MEHSSDRLLLCLTAADLAWNEAFGMRPKDRIAKAKEIHEYGLFSQIQLSKIVRVAPITISRNCPKTDKTGGRFAPEALTLLIYLRKAKLSGATLSASLVQGAVEAGCSIAMVARLTGWNYRDTYYAAKENREVQS